MLTTEQLEERRKQLQHQHDQARSNLTALAGALQLLDQQIEESRQTDQEAQSGRKAD